MYGDTWFCRECGDKAFKNWHKPLPLTKHPEARSFSEWSELERQSGKERNFEPVEIAPIPPYPQSMKSPGMTPSVPGASRLEDPELIPVQSIHDPEHEHVPVREHSPTPARTKPFLPSRPAPARRDPDPVQQVTPVSIVHVVDTEPLTHSPGPGAKTQKPAAFIEKDVATNLSPVSKPNLPNRAQNDNLVPASQQQKPTQKPRPHVTMPLPEKFTFVGRGVGRDRTFYEVIDLLNFTQKQGDFPDGTTDRMRGYYKRTYPEYFSRSKRAEGKRASNQQKANEIRAKHRPRRRKVKPVLHTA